MSTRERLLAAAEELYGGQGIDAVSLREIQRASGVKNATALQYHFGDRAGLLTAVLEKHSYDVELRRHALLDRYEAAGDQNVRALAEALVQPLASKLAESTGGCAYLCIYADLMNRRQPILPPGDLEDHADSIVRWRQLVDPFLDRTAARCTGALSSYVSSSASWHAGPRLRRTPTTGSSSASSPTLLSPCSRQQRRPKLVGSPSHAVTTRKPAAVSPLERMPATETPAASPRAGDLRGRPDRACRSGSIAETPARRMPCASRRPPSSHRCAERSP